MIKKGIYIAVFFLLVSFITPPQLASAQTSQETIQALLNQIAKLQSQINAVSGTQPSLPVALKRGDSGTLVKELQLILAAEGLFNGNVTGFFGPVTESAVKRLQQRLGLPQVGRYGPQTSQMVREKYKDGLPVALENTNGVDRACLPPGHLIAPGQAKNGLPNLPPCKTELPPGILSLIGQGGPKNDKPTTTTIVPPPAPPTPPAPPPAPVPPPPPPPSNLPTISIVASDTYATETSETKAFFVLVRSGDASLPTVVNLAFSGTATAGLDYQPIVATTIPAGFSSLPIELIATNDSTSEGTENAVLTIQPSATYQVGSPASVSAIIIDDDDSVTTSISGNVMNLSAVRFTPQEIRLSWTENFLNEDGFKVERSFAGSYIEIANLPPNTTSWIDFSAIPNIPTGSYSYRVKAFNDGGDSQFINTAVTDSN